MQYIVKYNELITVSYFDANIFQDHGPSNVTRERVVHERKTREIKSVISKREENRRRETHCPRKA
jgi:hypothetical protein